MTIDLPAAHRRFRRPALAGYVVPVGSDLVPIRAATVWPIADVLDVQVGPDAAPASGSASADAAAGLVLDLIDSGMIAPPRLRRRRERPVSSRAVFYQQAARD